jgi:hypothetical protein
MNNILLLALSGFLSLAVSDAAPPPVIDLAQTGVLVSTEHSMAQCSRIAHQTCDQVFGKCARFDEGATGSAPGYFVIYQCHGAKMTIGGVTALVIAGSGVEGTSEAKLSEWITKSYNLAYRSFK